MEEFDSERRDLDLDLDLDPSLVVTSRPEAISSEAK